MRRRTTLGEILRRTLLGSPLAFAMLGGTSCGGFGPCGSHVVIVNATPKPVADGGIDCSICNTYAVISCNPTTINGTTEVACNVQNECPGGRRPATLLASRSGPAPGSAGAFFASAARLEAASVVAFRVLAGELAAHRAPDALVAWCRRSAAEEVTHTRLTSALARRYNALPVRPAYSEATDVRPLEAIAIENAIEGCARESFGVVTAVWQARHAADPAVAESMRVIAGDELKHAELGWAIADWSSSKLTRAGRSQVVEARVQAARELLKGGSTSPAEEHLGGLPSVERHAELATRFFDAVAHAG